MRKQLKTLILLFPLLAIVYRRSLSTGFQNNRIIFDGTVASLFLCDYCVLISAIFCDIGNGFHKGVVGLTDNRESCFVSGEPALSGGNRAFFIAEETV